MDLDNIFGLFGFNKDNDNSKEESYLKEIEEYKSTPKYKVGMFYKMYTRAYYWIQECDIKKDEWKEALQHYLKQEGFENKECEKNSFINCFILSIKYFEEIEEFEKCAFLKNIQDYLKKEYILNLF